MTYRLSAILHAACRDSDTYTVYYDTSDGEVKARDVHHDGTNRYLFRELVSGFPPDAEEEFLESVKSGAVTMDEINRFTAQLGPRVEAVYGWRGGGGQVKLQLIVDMDLGSETSPAEIVDAFGEAIQ